MVAKPADDVSMLQAAVLAKGDDPLDTPTVLAKDDPLETPDGASQGGRPPRNPRRC